MYILSCDDNGTFIEQALLSIYSARYHNPDATIILIVDNDTNKHITGTREEVLNYISEKIVIPFSEDKTLKYRSRWLKTRIPEYVSGDFLFIDCDTIVQTNLDEIDALPCLMGAVPESHSLLKDLDDFLYQTIKNNSEIIGWDISKEDIYFSSGVLLVKGNDITRKLYDLWHTYWQLGENKVSQDQPSLARANIEVGHIIERIDNKWNCIMFTEPGFAYSSNILHFTALDNRSVLFSPRVLSIIKKNGVANFEYIKDLVLHPCQSYLPYDIEYKQASLSDWFKMLAWISERTSDYVRNIDPLFTDYHQKTVFNAQIKWLLKHKFFYSGTALYLLWKFYKIKLCKKH